MSGLNKTIALLEHLGGGNLGDDATVEAVMQNIKRRWPDSVVYGLSMNPADTELRHGITSYPIRRQTWTLGAARVTQEADDKTSRKIKRAIQRYPLIFKVTRFFHTLAVAAPRSFIQELIFLGRSFRVVSSFGILVVSGGGQLLDHWGGPWNYPYTIFKWLLLARLARVKCIVLNVGAGPIRHPLSKRLISASLALADYVSFRDDKSRSLLQDIGFKGKSYVFPDCVYGLEIKPPYATGARSRPNTVVGIAPMAYGDQHIYPEHETRVYDNLISGLGGFGLELLKSRHSLALFCSDIGVDPPALDDLEAAVRRHGHFDLSSIQRPILRSGRDLITAIGSMDYVVTCRFHGVVFSHLLNVPVLAISHHPKMTSLMADLGLSEYCIDIHDIDTSLLIAKFHSLVTDAPGIRRRMAAKAATYREALTRQLDDLFPYQLMPSVSAPRTSVAVC
jgi:polysaccharide pyruvyl transferase WcaK-like protein